MHTPFVWSEVEKKMVEKKFLIIPLQGGVLRVDKKRNGKEVAPFISPILMWLLTNTEWVIERFKEEPDHWRIEVR